MKHTIVLTFLLFISLQIFAQQNDTQKFRYIAKAEKYKRMQNTGTGLTIAGGVLAITGFAVMLNSSIDETTDSYGYTTTEINGHPVLGAGIFLVGAAGLGAGIPLWTIGAKKYRKFNEMAESVSLKFNASPRRAGVTLIYRF
jgi:hypothetical protein